MTEFKKADQTKHAAKSDVPNELRRTLLKTSWVVPVITVVGLPAHAQTSPCTQRLTINGRTHTCDGPEFRDNKNYIIDDTNVPCATLIQTSSDDYSISVEVYYNSRAFGGFIDITVGTPDEPNGALFTKTCNSSLEESKKYTLSVAAISGTIWRARFTLAEDATSATLSDIVLTPK